MEPAELPRGPSGILSGVTENLSFHASPESFIASRVLQYYKSNPEQIDQRACVRATILNRNVAIVSSYKQVQAVLGRDSDIKDGEEPDFVATAPYRRLMEPFFPPPNLLLQDGCPHARMKASWKPAVDPLCSPETSAKIRSLTIEFLKRTAPSNQTEVDLYTTLKTLSWELFLSTFLELQPSDPDFATFESLQDDLLRGQFSLLSVSINTGFWHSPRKVGIDSRKKLQVLIAKRLQTNPPSWMPEFFAKENMDETVNHILMSTSSLAVKGFASLLLALLINLYIHRGDKSEDNQSLMNWIRSDSSEIMQQQRTTAVMKETLRLSPPIVGVMRRATVDTTLPSHDGESPNVRLPAGWDVWSYFPGANRDPSVFDSPNIFDQKRYLDETSCEPIAFGLGGKKCLGSSIVENMALAVVKGFPEAGVSIEGSVDAPGVRAWLGWEVAEPEQWARDMKQLPTQRPSKTVMCTLCR